MNKEIKKIRDYIKCPQFGDVEYGKWGILNLEQRKAFKRLCDYIESSDNYITNLQEENQKLKEDIEEISTSHFVLFKRNGKIEEENQKLKEQLNCKEYFSSTMQENTEFVILTKNNYDRQQKDLALENIELKQENQKLNKIIDELEKWLETLKERYIEYEIGDYALYQNVLDKLTKLKKEVE